MLSSMQTNRKNEIGNYLDCSFVKHLTNDKLTGLIVKQRYDDELWNISQDIYDKKSVGLSNNSLHDICDFNICFTNRKRKEINRICNQRNARNLNEMDYVVLSEDASDDYTQDVILFKDVSIISRTSCKELGVYNNQQLIVGNIRDCKKTIKLITEEGDEVKVDRAEFQTKFAPSYCITAHKSQGSTITEKYNIHEWGKMDRNIRYTAITRAKNLSQVGIWLRKSLNNLSYNYVQNKIHSYQSQDQKRNRMFNLSYEEVKKLIRDSKEICARCNCELELKGERGLTLDRRKLMS